MRLLRLALLGLIHIDRADDHKAGDDGLPVDGDIQNLQAAGQHAEDQRADEGIEHLPLAAGQGDSADDAGGDGVHLVAGAGIGVRDEQTAQQHQTGDRREDTGQDIDADLQLLDLDAGQLRGLDVAAQGIDPAAEAGVGHAKWKWAWNRRAWCP